jgi:hypothetical protein
MAATQTFGVTMLLIMNRELQEVQSVPLKVKQLGKPAGIIVQALESK